MSTRNAKGLLKPVFCDPSGVKELFCLLYANFFKNWKIMEGKRNDIENIKNFTIYQIELLLFNNKFSQVIAKSSNFFEYDAHFSSYLTERDNWLKVDINSIIKEPIKLNEKTLKELEASIEVKINKMISASRVKSLTGTDITLTRIHDKKNKLYSSISLTESFAFKVFTFGEGEHLGSQKAVFYNIKDLEIVADGKPIPPHIKSTIDETTLKKITKETMILYFKNHETLLFEPYSDGNF